MKDPLFQRKIRLLNRLMLLHLLTYCDSKANGEQNFSSLDKDNLRQLYERIVPISLDMKRDA